MNPDLRSQRPFFHLGIAVSSLLLFLVQPMLAKAILPTFGGSAGVWVTAMLFFQTMLLAGYLYAWLLTRLAHRRLQGAIHVVLLLGSLAMLPVKPHLQLATSSPSLSILVVLFASVGLPCFVLSSTSPLLQSWYSGTFPYRLFALSNAASGLGLLSYPFLIEPQLGAKVQLQGWSGAYVVVVFAIGAAALMPAEAGAIADAGATARRPLVWIALAACGSALWLAVANHLSQEVAPVPLLWVLPLSLYLLSFILCFEGRNWYRPALFRWLLPLAWAAAGYRVARPGGIVTEISAFSAALFVWCMFCHGELARVKPQNRSDLTFFYLMLALGGALGAVFVAIVAPNAFRAYLELPIGIIASVLLALPMLYGVVSKARLIRLGVVAVAAFAIAVRFQAGAGVIVQTRNFYGALQVSDSGTGEDAFRSLYNGRTLHGVEFLLPSRSRAPTTYYGPESGAGQLLKADGPSRRVGIVGLGAGTLAAYGRSGDFYRFYEINPAVVEIAQRSFRFLDTSRARIDLVTGDGRLALEMEPANDFDAIVLDAFSDDSIPVHLLTQQAFATYFRVLRPNGVIAIHLTNRYLDLNPVVQSLAASFGKRAMRVHNEADAPQQILAADWALVYRESTVSSHPTRRPWTDDYSNLFQVIK